MSEPIWNGRLGLTNDLLRAEGKETPLINWEIAKIVNEIVATQRGTLAANNGVSRVESKLEDLKTRVDESDKATLDATLEALNSLTAAVSAAQGAVGAFLLKLGELLQQPAPDLSALSTALTNNSGATTGAVQELCRVFAERDKERDELLSEFGSIQEFREALTAALLMRRFSQLVIRG